jgi:hypothetical protein
MALINTHNKKIRPPVVVVVINYIAPTPTPPKENIKKPPLCF